MELVFRKVSGFNVKMCCPPLKCVNGGDFVEIAAGIATKSVTMQQKKYAKSFAFK